MTQDDERPRRRWRKWLLWLGAPNVIFTLPTAIAVAIIGWDHHVANRELQEICAELDDHDPGWRLEEIEASLPVVPDDENAALRVAAVKAKLPAHHAPWLIFDVWEQELRELKPTAQLNEQQEAELAEALKDNAPAVEEAQAFAKLSRGRYTIQWSADVRHSSDGAIQDVRSVAHLLSLHAMWRAQENDLEGAWVSSQAIYNAGRSLGTPQYFIPLLGRNAIRSVALSSMERTLAQGEVSEATLATTQRALEEDAALPLLHLALRGERAVINRMFVNLETGALPMSFIYGPGVQPKIEYLASQRDYIPRNHAWYLRRMTDVIGAADRSPQALKQLSQQRHPDAPGPLAALAATSDAPAASYYRVQARLNCAIVALAIERFRLKHGHWPTQLTDLTPAILNKSPLDPYDGKPLRYRILDDCVVIYSIGPDGQDDGGNIDDLLEPGTDIGFRLWNPGQRRQPAVSL